MFHFTATAAFGNFWPLNPIYVATDLGPIRHTEFALVEIAEELVFSLNLAIPQVLLLAVLQLLLRGRLAFSIPLGI